MPLPCDVEAPGQARQALRSLDAAAPVGDDAVLLASELVSSAVLGSEWQGPLELVACEFPGGLSLSVIGEAEDEWHATLSWVVSALARDCGVECREGRARLWAELPT